MIDASTKVFCIIGNPVRHSFSPALHNAAFQKAGLNAVYTAFEVFNVEDALKGMKAMGISGASVTIPHKMSVIPYIDEVTDIAGMIGSVNTLIMKDNKIKGDNTDAPGFFRALSEKTKADNKTIAVFGAGGAGRAILFALFYYSSPSKVYILDTDAKRREGLKENICRGFKQKKDFETGKVEAIANEKWGDIKGSIDIIIHATPMGMEPDNNSSVLTEDDIPEGRVLMDIVYHPHETKLIQNAKRKKCRIVYGIDMLLYQGALQFELWTGLKAPVGTMRKALNKKVYNR